MNESKTTTNNNVEKRNVRTIEPKVFALLIETRETTFLSLQYTYSLEEAFALAKLEFESQENINLPPGSLLGAKIGLFAIKPLKVLTADPDLLKKKIEVIKGMKKITETLIENITSAVEVVRPESPETTIKNDLMNKIVKNKDRALYEEKKSTFNEFECAYIEKHLD